MHDLKYTNVAGKHKQHTFIIIIMYVYKNISGTLSAFSQILTSLKTRENGAALFIPQHPEVTSLLTIILVIF